MHKSMLRRLLVVDLFDEFNPIVSEVQNAGWAVELCSLDQAFTRQADVGLIRLGPCLDTIGELLRRTPAQWIAALPPGTSLNGHVGLFVAEWCFDFHSLPFDWPRLLATLGHALGMASLRRAVQVDGGGELLGNAPCMRELRKLLGKLGPTDSPVLIRGESGTGKELVARALHRLSRRAEQAFVALNCGAIPEQLIQSELFGHEKGAFTGAHQRKIGRIESAHDGTLFLDEIGDLPLDLQANLLRFLQEGQIERVGGNQLIEVNVRVLAATHIDLEQAVERGRFREDLYYRLNVLQVHTSPLRERLEDVPALARYFARLYADEVGRRPRSFSEEALRAMSEYAWPGNVRELANRVRRGLVLAEGRQIAASDLGFREVCGSASQEDYSLERYKMQAEKQALSDVLRQYSANHSHAARALGVSRPTFYRLLNKHRIR
ncbi:sigma-54 dependent transcriptional regulator [Pseudomonas sp. MAP12]|uniref:Sigma-54 dependent transcriptional regulator n=1 Tax=Geopseudomonas aromaticivorans TaxID=2849492 RepID=A0ABS6MW36_9GAMM|nr:sigma-54 dependent transcriptional regulator [Pseudomonas aromaticivorans]MBV2133010.1 sigma-54 dependent transcriptional regulator [Pseudomonas aromaticivorans]